ncbi:class F sortase [Mumia sp. ZJ1417]|uniref:class F sortase n=1 Tax=unclassified Mumia TaxID=2621872 RepID=UPI001422C11B|nr:MULTISPECIES: class F sortase [unclassified Mumia]QMW67163.1 class F sortase [Mumia sp. ZJ1417]
MTTEPDLVTVRREARARRRARARVRAAIGAVVGVVGVACVAWAIMGAPAPATAPSSASVTPTPQVTTPTEAAGGTVALPKGRARPRLVVIPALGVKAPVEPMPVIDGVLTPPSPATTVGWWDRSARPGSSRGTVVVAGHKVQAGGGAFDTLGTLNPGDRATLRTMRGRVHYVVKRVVTYDRATLAQKSKSIFRQGGRPRLILITCEDWDGQAYRSNTVVYATPVS